MNEFVRLARMAAAVALLIVVIASCRERTAGRLPQSKLVDLSTSLEAARTAFNAHRGEARFLTLLSPTCGACQHGARAVSQVIVQNSATRSLTPMVAWIPMLFTDDLPAADEASDRFHGLAVAQFWDGSKRLGKEVGASGGADAWTSWDVCLVYPPLAEW